MQISNDIIDAVRAAMDLAGDPGRHRVVVAMSGGVDSSCVAGLVAAAGFDTVGITLQLYDHGAALSRKGACCAGRDIHDARRVAAMLGMPHYVLDYESRFRAAVIDEFASSYAQGRNAGAVRAVQPDGQVRRSRAPGAGPRRFRPGHRPLCGEPGAG